MSQELLDDRVRDLRRELAAEFAKRIPQSKLDECLSSTLTAYEDARIRDYVPLLVRREARARLLQMAAGNS